MTDNEIIRAAQEIRRYLRTGELDHSVLDDVPQGEHEEALFVGTLVGLCLPTPPEPVIESQSEASREFVYFIQDDIGRIKIGRSKDPIARLKALAIGNPSLSLLATIEGGSALEARLHRQFAQQSIGGEWFEPSDALLALVNDPTNHIPIQTGLFQ